MNEHNTKLNKSTKQLQKYNNRPKQKISKLIQTSTRNEISNCKHQHK